MKYGMEHHELKRRRNDRNFKVGSRSRSIEKDVPELRDLHLIKSFKRY